MSAQKHLNNTSEQVSQNAEGDLFGPFSTSISTPRKRQKTVDLGLEGATGLITPPDSRHKRSARASIATVAENFVDDEGRVGTDRSAKRRRVNSSVPAPNPPSAPFPTPRKIVLRVRPAEIATPPATPSTKGSDSRNPQEFPLTPESSSKQRQVKSNDLTPWKRVDALPPHLANLLALHKSFDLALSLHVATHPPVLPPLESSLLQAHEYGLKSLDVDLDALTNYVALKPIVEKSCGKRFGLAELKRLMWLWQWNGEDEEEVATNGKPIRDVGNSPFLDDEIIPASGRGYSSKKKRDANLTACYNVTPTRTIDNTTSRRVHTYGFGIRITLTPREAASACNTLHSFNDAFGNAGKAVGAVARWSAGSEARCKEIERRLWAWVHKHSSLEREIRGSTSLAYPESPTGSHDVESRVPHVPCAALPQLQQAVGNLMPAFTLATSTVADPTSPSSRLALANRSSPSSSVQTAAPGLLPPPAFRSVNQRLQAVAGSLQPSLDTLGGATTRLPAVNGESQAEGSQSLLNDDVFGPVLMIPKEKKPTAAGSVEARQQALYERIKARANKDVVISSSRSAVRGGRLAMSNMSAAQTQDELKRRSTLSRLEGVAEAVWIPGSSPRAKRRAFPVSEVIDVVVKSSKSPISGPEAYDSLMLLAKLCPSFLVLRTIAKQEWLEMPSAAHSISSPGNRINLAGPSSPGKVMMRGGGGSLREVRERIRRELNDM
ncbi:hypothetical protein QFC19_000603 [Naganishia cerealis]|uniref:Uncharacterized protein n=1 Tax=Naganishia cerealis TaxID=610337 RepID=A0ACC2WLH2_9TREE|nr:hypothetical protein QFC19_000603 [Naganishia cerealis]